MNCADTALKPVDEAIRKWMLLPVPPAADFLAAFAIAEGQRFALAG